MSVLPPENIQPGMYNVLLYFQVLFNMVVEVPRWSNAKMEVRRKKQLILFFTLVLLQLLTALVKAEIEMFESNNTAGMH